MNWKNRLRLAEEDADDDDEDDDENDDYGNYEGVLNSGVAEFGLAFSPRNFAGYALDAKLLTKPKDCGGWRNDVGKIFPTSPNPVFRFSPRIRFESSYYRYRCCCYRCCCCCCCCSAAPASSTNMPRVSA